MEKLENELMKNFNISKDKVKSNSYAIKQPQSNNDSVNINYICPKYWDRKHQIPLDP